MRNCGGKEGENRSFEKGRSRTGRFYKGIRLTAEGTAIVNKWFPRKYASLWNFLTREKEVFSHYKKVGSASAKDRLSDTIKKDDASNFGERNGSFPHDKKAGHRKRGVFQHDKKRVLGRYKKEGF